MLKGPSWPEERFSAGPLVFTLHWSHLDYGKDSFQKFTHLI